MIIKNIIICEDIRPEVGNKISAMGILGSTLNLERLSHAPKEPTENVSLAFLISFFEDDTASDPSDLSVKISISLGEKILVNLTARIQSRGEGGVSHLPIPKFTFGVTANARLSVHAQVMKKDTLVSEDTCILDIRLRKSQKNKMPSHAQDKTLNPTR